MRKGRRPAANSGPPAGLSVTGSAAGTARSAAYGPRPRRGRRPPTKWPQCREDVVKAWRSGCILPLTGAPEWAARVNLLSGGNGHGWLEEFFLWARRWGDQK